MLIQRSMTLTKLGVVYGSYGALPKVRILVEQVIL